MGSRAASWGARAASCGRVSARCGRVPQGADASPHDADGSPHDADTSPHGADASPHDADASPHGADASPHDADTSPHGADASPHDADASPHHADASPHDADGLRTVRTRRGRTTKRDYVWNPILERWQLAIETVELKGIVGSVRGVSSQRHAIGAATAMVLFGLMGMAFIPLIGAFVAFVGLILFVMIGVGALRSKRA